MAGSSESVPQAVRDVLRCSEAIERRRRRQAKEEASESRADERRRSRAKLDANRDLKEQYMAVLQRRDGANRNASHATRVKTLQKMVVMQGLPLDTHDPGRRGSGSGVPSGATLNSNAAAAGANNDSSSSTNFSSTAPSSSSVSTALTGSIQEEEKCSLRGLVWKVLLGAYHIDAMLYVRLVEQGASWKDYLIKQDTFRTFKGDEAFRRRVPEEKLSRLNNAFVRLNFPEHDPLLAVAAANSAATLQQHVSSSSPSVATSALPSSNPVLRSAVQHSTASTNSPTPPHSPTAAALGAAAGVSPASPSAQSTAATTPRRSAMQHSASVSGHQHFSSSSDDKAAAGSSSSSSSTTQQHGGSAGGYVQGMTILCAPFLFVMPEVDAFFCFNALLTRHLPRYVTPTLDGVHAGCALIGKVLQAVDPELHAHLSGRTGDIKIFAFPILMSLHACMPPLEETLKVWDVLFAYGVHMEVLVVAAQCLLVRARLLADPNPYNQLNFRYLPPLDSEILVSAAFCLIPHVPQSLLDEIARHPLADPFATAQQQARGPIATSSCSSSSAAAKQLSPVRTKP